MGCSVLEDAKWSLELGDLGQSSSLRVKIEVYNCLNGQFYSGPWLGVHWLLSSSFLTPDKARSWHLGGSQEGAATPPGPLLHVNMQRTCDGVRREGSLAAVGLNWCLKVYFETTTCSKCDIHILCRTSRVITQWELNYARMRNHRTLFLKSFSKIYWRSHIARFHNSNPLCPRYSVLS